MTAGTWWQERCGLSGTVAVITGGAGGLGAAVTSDLAANGAHLAVVDKDAAAVDVLRTTLDKVAGDAGADAVLQVGDARDPEVLAALFAAVDERWNRVDTLVNVVGGTFRAPFVDSSPKGWDALLRTNFLHVLHACHLAAPRMQAGGRGGSIVNLSTIEAHRAAPGFAVYAAAKAAVEQFARTLAVELAPDGIRVNNVAPDYAPTPSMRGVGIADGGMSVPAAARVGIPMARVGTMSDVSNCVVFLASGLSAFVTGSTLHPDGGTHASSGWFNWPGTGWANHVPPSVLARLPEATGEPV